LRIFSLVAAFYFFFFAAIGVYVIYLPKVLKLLGYTPTQIGIVYAISPLMRFVTPFFFLRRFSLTATVYRAALLLSVAAGALFFPTIGDFWLFLLANLLLGISFALTLPYAETIALKHIGKERYGRARLFGSLGFIAAALALAPYMQEPRYALWFLFGALLFTAIFGWFLGAAGIQQERQSEKGSFSLLRHWPLWANLFLMQVSFGPFYNFFTIYASEHGLDYTTISHLWTFGVVAEIVMLYFQGPLLKRDLLRILRFCSAVTAFRWLLIHLYPDNLWILFFAQSLHAFSFALYYSAAISYLFRIYADKTLAQQFFGGISFGLGGMVGSFLAGLFYGPYLFAYAAAVALLATLVLQKTDKNEK